MAPDEVASHQRVRIHFAMIEIVGEDGYGAVTVRRLSQLAGVSTKTFYDHFEGKEECFLRTYEAVVQGAAERIADSQAHASDWLERMERGIEEFARQIEAGPCAARLTLVEAFAAGPAALERMRSTENLFESMVAESFNRAPGSVETPPLIVKGIVAGLSCTARSRLLAGCEKELPGLVGELLEWMLSFYGDASGNLVELDRAAALKPLGGPPDTSAPRRPSAGARTPEDSRELILSATTKLAFVDGYRQLTAPRICSAAGVRRRSFDAHFKGVTDCFLTALEVRTFRILDCAVRASAGGSWPSGVSQAISVLCRQIALDPVFAKLAFIETFASGEDGVRCRERIMAAIAKRFRASAPLAQRPDRLAARASVGAVWGILHYFVTLGRAQQLPQLVPMLSFLSLAPAIGPSAAEETIRKELVA